LCIWWNFIVLIIRHCNIFSNPEIKHEHYNVSEHHTLINLCLHSCITNAKYLKFLIILVLNMQHVFWKILKSCWKNVDENFFSRIKSASLNLTGLKLLSELPYRQRRIGLNNLNEYNNSKFLQICGLSEGSALYTQVSIEV